MALGRKTKIILVSLGVILAVSGPIAFVVAETFTGGFNQFGTPGKFNASQGPVVTLGQNFNLEGGQPATSKSINLSKEDGAWLNVSAEANGPAVTIDVINSTAGADSWTNVSSISGTGSANITLQPSDKNFTRVGGGADSLKFLDMKVNDGQTDLIYTASSSATIVVETNASDGTQYGLVDQSNDQGLDVAVADSDGTVAFTDVPTSTSETEARIEELGDLTIREETEPHAKITSATVTLRFYETVDDNPTIETRETNNGEVDLTGLPVDEAFAVHVEAPGFYNRTVLIDDLSQQEDVFLLNTTATADEITFTLEDPTGQFTSEDAEIVAQRAINTSQFSGDGWKWLTIAGDKTGAANSLTVSLQHEVRHRLRVSDGAGDTRVVGAYTTTGDDTVILRPSAPEVNVTDDEKFAWNVTYENTSTGGNIVFEYSDPKDNTTDLDVYIYEVGNQSNDFPVQTVSGPLGYTKITQSLTEEQAERNWKVEWNATYNSEEIGADTVVGQHIETVLTDLAPWIRHAIAAIAVILTGGLFTVVNAKAGAVVTSFVGGGFWMFGWLPAEAGAAIMVALFIAVLWKAAEGRVG